MWLAPCNALDVPGTWSGGRARAGSFHGLTAIYWSKRYSREMAAGRVEAIRVPINCLDVLAQQLVALASMDEWRVPDLFALMRCAYPYRDLTPEAFETTLEMISGRFNVATLECEARSAKRRRRGRFALRALRFALERSDAENDGGPATPR